jgi:hypothetical protein
MQQTGIKMKITLLIASFCLKLGRASARRARSPHFLCKFVNTSFLAARLEHERHRKSHDRI